MNNMQNDIQKVGMSYSDVLTVVKEMLKQYDLSHNELIQSALFFSVCEMFTLGMVNAHGIDYYIRQKIGEVSLETGRDISMDDLPMEWRIVSHKSNYRDIFRSIKIELKAHNGKKIIMEARDIHIDMEKPPTMMTTQEQAVFIRKALESILRNTLASISIVDKIAKFLGFKLSSRRISIVIE